MIGHKIELEWNLKLFLPSWTDAMRTVKEKIKTDKRIIKRASELEELGFHAMDAAHISYAERGAEVMLTTDDDVLRMARIKRNQIYIEIENPVRWLINVFQNGC